VPLEVEGGSVKQPATVRLQAGAKGRLAYVSYSSDCDIYQVPGPGAELMEPPAAPKLVAGSSRYDTAPRFSPNGDRIVFVSDRSGNAELWVANSDGSNPVRITSLRGPAVGGPRWSPDGERIVFDASVDQMDVFVVNAGGGEVRRLTTEPSTEGGASWSRDGRWIYFISDASGHFEIRRMPAEGGPSERIVERGLAAFESPDGKWLYYPKSFRSQGDPGIWRIPVGGGEEEQVLEEGVSGTWALSQSGIYLLKPGGPDRLPTLELFRYDTWEREVAYEFKKVERFGIYNALTVTDDDRSIAFIQYNETEADLMLVENFR
jgi:Tol biopolymer transport system component